jgi:hypothetical protein
MRHVLAILGSLVLCGTAWADEPSGRAALSYEENAIINTVCAQTLKQNVGAFQACATRQVAVLHDHPTPDRSALSPAYNQAIERTCGHLKRFDIGQYNDCVRKAMAAPEPPRAENGNKELSSN